MADSFQPKFVDLVRNFTSSMGTGNLVLGDPAPGFTSFTDALQPGDSFYYCVAGLDKTSESEVGRGTLEADGTIARTAINGALTNFSSGTKTVALVAAAEWFESVGGVQAGTATAADRNSLASMAPTGPVLLTEAGRGGLFLFDPSDLSAKVEADSAQGLYVAPAADASGASGAWTRSFEGPVNPVWFGLIEGDNEGNGASNDAAIAAMFSSLAARAVNYETSSQTRTLDNVRFPPGVFWFSAPIDIKDGTLVLSGGAAAGRGGGGSVLKFASGCTGIRVQHRNTSGAATKDDVDHFTAKGTIIENLSLRGSFSGSEAEAHGVHLRAVATARNLNIRNFEGDGIRFEADSTTTGGAASTMLIENVVSDWNRNGLYSDGDNANAGTIILLNANNNRQWGIWDSSYLGNSYIGCHTNANGITPYNDGAAIGASVVSHNGNLYYAKAGEAGGASVNAPSGAASDNQWWGYIGTGNPETGKPAWSSGMLVREGGAYHDDSINAKNLWLNCYAEGNQGHSQWATRSLVLNGQLADMTSGFEGHLYSSASGLSTGGRMTVAGNLTVQGTTATFGPNSGTLNSGYNFDNSSASTYLNFRSWSGGVPLTDAYLRSLRGTGLMINGSPRICLRSNDINVAIVDPERLAVQPGYALGLSPGAAPAAPADGDLWYDSGSGRFRKAEGGGVSDLSEPADKSVTYAKIQDVAGSDVVLGRTSGSGSIEEISCTAAGRAMIACADAAAQRDALEVVRGIGFHCAGAPGPDEVIGGGVAPYPFTISAAGSACKALVAATAETTISVRNNGTEIGTIVFAAGSTSGTVTVTEPSILAGDQITFHAPAASDSTLADIDALVRE